MRMDLDIQEDNEGVIRITTGDSRKGNFRFLSMYTCLYIRRGWDRVLFKYSGKYVNIYFNMKITF